MVKIKMNFKDRIMHAWNAFRNKDPAPSSTVFNFGTSYAYRPDRSILRHSRDRSIITAVLNRLAVDAAAAEIKHVRLDENERYVEDIKSGLNDCLNVSANIDQSGRAFRQDVYMSMFDEGVVAIVPTDADFDPTKTGSFSIDELRTGKVISWLTDKVKMEVYNKDTGRREQITLPKKVVAIVENPFYAVMNEPNSTLQRLLRKLNLLDFIDEQNSSGKLDLIVQLPYDVRGQVKKGQAEERLQSIEDQLVGSKYGIAYVGATEKIVQLNRPVENNLMAQVEYLTSMLYSQLGITKEIMDGTAPEEVMNNYYERTIEPIVAAPVDEMKRKFLTRTARTQGQSIMAFTNSFKLMPTSKIPEMADKLTRNEVMAPNEFRQILGLKPSDDARADELRNRNISQSVADQMAMPQGIQNGNPEGDYESRLQELDDFDAELDELERLNG